MTDINERVEHLEKTIDELQLEVHASRLAITILYKMIDKQIDDPAQALNPDEQEKSSAPLVKFNHPEQEEYEEKLTQRVLALLTRSEKTV
ncbi:hypothetical protein [Enterobacter soli]|uniref:hypothetical protein n=1 Tax=Enterobacter soli TaxID=885040 RepID=UPI0034CF93C8